MTLPTHRRVNGDTIEDVVDDGEARWPIAVDPILSAGETV